MERSQPQHVIGWLRGTLQTAVILPTVSVGQHVIYANGTDMCFYTRKIVLLSCELLLTFVKILKDSFSIKKNGNPLICSFWSAVQNRNHTRYYSILQLCSTQCSLKKCRKVKVICFLSRFHMTGVIPVTHLPQKDTVIPTDLLTFRHQVLFQNWKPHTFILAMV